MHALLQTHSLTVAEPFFALTPTPLLLGEGQGVRDKVIIHTFEHLCNRTFYANY
jgi:hypothetical protein